jgi:hypothetical protein
MWGRLEKNQETFIVVLHELQLFAQIQVFWRLGFKNIAIFYHFNILISPLFASSCKKSHPLPMNLGHLFQLMHHII